MQEKTVKKDQVLDILYDFPSRHFVTFQIFFAASLHELQLPCDFITEFSAAALYNK